MCCVRVGKSNFKKLFTKSTLMYLRLLFAVKIECKKKQTKNNKQKKQQKKKTTEKQNQ